MVNEFSGIPENDINVTEMKNSFSFVKIRPDQVSALISGCKNQSYNDRPVRVEMRHEGSRDNSSLKERRPFNNRSKGGDFGERRKFKRNGNSNSSYKKPSRQRTYSK